MWSILSFLDNVAFGIWNYEGVLLKKTWYFSLMTQSLRMCLPATAASLLFRVSGRGFLSNNEYSFGSMR